jgi:hypothetical protein
MASPEVNRTTGENIGRGALIVGLALLTYGIIESFAVESLPTPDGVSGGELGVLGGTLAVAGVIFERVSGKKKKQ